MVRTRIAPSPTGIDVHVGTIATALIDYAWAKKNNGQFIIRIEDTDKTRAVPGSEEKMLKTFNDLGLHSDESPTIGGPYKPYRQSERLPLYKKYAEELVAKGYAYYCTCTQERLENMRNEQQAQKKIPRYDRYCLHNQEEIKKQIQKNTQYVIRLLVPKGEITFTDIIRGQITITSDNIDDQVLMKSDGFPTYHMAVVVDDHLMEITHIIRGEEWLSSTPKHVILYNYFGWELPVFCHLSLLRNPDKSKLSKRKNPVWASDYLEKGILKEALLNYLSLMGWSHPDEKEIFSLEEYIRVFDIKDLQSTAPVFDPTKLEWMNGEYIRQLKVQSLKLKIIEFFGEKYPGNIIEKTIPLIQERIKTLAEYDEYCHFFIEAPHKYEIDLSKYKELFKKTHSELSLVIKWKADKIGEAMQKVAELLGIKNSEYFMAIRVAITGKKITPPLNESMELLGKDECLNRLNNQST